MPLYERTSIEAELLARTGGRGPDVCIEAVRQAVHACSRGGSVFVLSVFAGVVKSDGNVRPVFVPNG